MTEQNRIEALRLQAQQLLQIRQSSSEQPQEFEQLNTTKLLEELNIYHAELEIQNQELRQAQSHLQRERDHYRSLFQLMPVACLLIGSQGKILDLNEPALTMLGFKSLQQAQEVSVYRLLNESGSAWLLNELKGKSGQTRHHKFEVTAWNRIKRPVNGGLIRLPSPNSLHGDAILILQDASTETQLEQERRQFSSVMDHSPAMIFVLDADLRLLLANKEFIRFHQLESSELVGRSVLSFFPNASLQRIKEYYDSLFIRGISQTYEYEYSSPLDNKVYFFQTTAFAIRNSSSEIISAGFITTDVSLRKDAESRLQTAMQIFSEGSEGIIIADRESSIISVNHAFEVITGYRQEDVLGKKPSILSSGLHDKEFYRNMWAMVMDEGHWEGEIWNKRKSGEVYPQWLNISRLPKKGPVVKNFIAVFSDISERMQSQKYIENLAYFDSLTGLTNRNLLRDRVEHCITLCNRTSEHFVLLFFDLDKFKDINDMHGHDIGDRLLVTISERMRSMFRESDTLCRLGGDEFVVLLPGIDRAEGIIKAQSLITLIAEPVVLGDLSLKVTCSAGLVEYPVDGQNYHDLLKKADLAMYRAKAEGKNQISQFDASMIERLKRRIALTAALEHALDNQEMWVAFQPILSDQKNVVGFEALLRWNSPTFGVISPDEFIPLAEESGDIHELGIWVLEMALKQVKQLQQDFKQQFYVSVNVSAPQFWSETFPEQVKACFDNESVSRQSLQLEITERIAMQNPETASQVVRRLKNEGISIALDDFGTGYSSLAYLKHLPIDVLKVDKSFVMDIGTDPDDEEICRTIINLARSLGLSTTAEGVEKLHQLEFLKQIGCTHLQGYLFAKPMAAVELSQWLESQYK